MSTLRVLGMISGTSHDGIDLAVVEFSHERSTGQEVVHGRVTHQVSVPYSQELRRDLVGALPPGSITAADVCALDVRIGQEFAAAARAALSAVPVDLVCSHGQTVFHWVDGSQVRGTLQLGQPSWIAEATGLPVVADVRTADVAAGGQGAPLVPLLDRLLLGPTVATGARVGALNLGGISNVTVCAPDAEPVAWDIGPANALIDAVVAADPSTPDAYDRDGALAAAGTVDEELLEQFLAEAYYALPAPKTSGKELFHAGYVEDVLAAAGRVPRTADLVATLTSLTARTVADALRANAVEVVFASGGGVRNPVLMARLAEELPGVEVRRSDELGAPADVKEAIAFALIGWATAHGLPGNVPACTGAAGPRVLGSVTPGRNGYRLAEPLTEWPTRLVLT